MYSAVSVRSPLLGNKSERPKKKSSGHVSCGAVLEAEKEKQYPPEKTQFQKPNHNHY
jgi:hypothetical protein